jgi:hypothetical protein
MPSMSPQDALQLLDEVTQQVNANRKVHAAIQEALAVLARAVAPIEKSVTPLADVPPHREIV